MDPRKERELERLVSTICDDGASAQDVHALESLLSNDPAIQERYWQLMTTHIALGVAVSCDANKSLPGLVSRPVHNRSRIIRSWPSASLGDSRKRFIYYAAAILLLSLGLGIWSLLGPDLVVAVNDGADSEQIKWSVGRIPTITHVSWDGPTFSRDDDQWRVANGAEAGPVSLQVKQGPSANGYLFCLPPGTAVELIATFHATGENCLSIAELISDDRQPLRKATFNNCGDGPRPLDANPAATNRRFGVLGRWFERNETPSPRYFLLTGSHKLARPKPDQDWQLSEMAVLLERDGVVHIGWDDSGPAPAEEGKAYRPDDDFDDLAATLILSMPTSTASPQRSITVVGDDRGTVQGTLPFPTDAWRMTLAPGEMAVLKVASKAATPNALVLVDADTGSRCWVASNTSNSHALAKSRDLGAAAVRNISAEPRDMLLFAAHRVDQESSPGPEWRASERKTFFEQPGYVILGFEDAGRDEDFDDVYVSVLRVDSAGMPATPVDRTSNRVH